MAYCYICQEEHELGQLDCMDDVICKGCGELGHIRLECKKTNINTKENNDDELSRGQKRKGCYVNEVNKKVANSIEVDSNIINNSEYYEMFCKDESDEEKPLLYCSSANAPGTSIQTPKATIDEKKRHFESEKDSHSKQNESLTSRLSIPKNPQLIFVHIETFHSSKSSSTHLTQIGCCSDTSDFFCAIEPPVLTKYLDRYKLGGDLLKALHMTREEDGTFQFRSQFEIVTDQRKKIVCVSEKEAIMNFQEFLEGFENCFVVAIDEETLSILFEKVKDLRLRRNKNTLLLHGYTYWRRILEELEVPNTHNGMELEEFYNQINGSDLTGYLSSKDISYILKKCVDELVHKFCHNDYYGIFLQRTLKQEEDLPKLAKKPQRDVEREEIEVSSSFRPSVSATFTAEKLEQVTIESESDEEGEALVISDINEKSKGKIKVTELVEKNLNSEEDISILPSFSSNHHSADINAPQPHKHNGTQMNREPLYFFYGENSEKPEERDNLRSRKEEVQRTIPPVSKEQTWQFLPGNLINCPIESCGGSSKTQVNMKNIGKHLKKVHRSQINLKLKCGLCSLYISQARLNDHFYVNHNLRDIESQQENNEKKKLEARYNFCPPASLVIPPSQILPSCSELFGNGLVPRQSNLQTSFPVVSTPNTRPHIQTVSSIMPTKQIHVYRKDNNQHEKNKKPLHFFYGENA